MIAMEDIHWKYGDDVRYAYAVGVIRVLETRSLSKERVERAADAANADDVLRVLAETPYAEYLSGLPGPDAYESFLEQEHEKALDLLDTLTEDPPLTELLWCRFDFHNLKVALKEKFGGQDLASAYVRFGRVPIPAIKTAVVEEDLSLLSAGLADAAAPVLRGFAERKDPKWIDFVLDRTMYERFVATTCSEGNLFFYELVRREIDVINILSLFRTRRSGDERGQFVEAFLEGGILSRDVFLQMFDEPLEAVPGRFAYTAYRSLVEDGWAHLDREGSFAVFERAGRETVLEYLRRAKLIAFGVEPLIAYLYAKENEIRMIRTIMVGKLNHVESNVIKESLPRVYA